MESEMPKQEWEEDAKERFLEYLRDKRSEAWTVLDEDVVVDASTNRNFDYELGLGQRRIALELFRLVDDGEELARIRVWGEVVNALESELARRSLKGYLLTTPSYLMVPKVKRDAFVREMADRIEGLIGANSAADEIPFDGFSLKRIEGLGTIACSAFGKGGAINPPGIALAALQAKLPNKNDQLAIAAHERVLFVVNWSHLVGVDDVLEAASMIDFGRFPNVDKIFFEVAPGSCQQVFDRSLFSGFETGTIAPTTELEPLFIAWLQSRLARKERQAFDIVKKLAGERGGVLWLPAISRIEVVGYGAGFVKIGDWENVNWILLNFKNDPDPSTENAADDPEGQFNYHRSIERGENVRFILTVRGHLCWLLQEIVKASKAELYEEVFAAVEQYALGANLYVRRQATVPLIELAKHRYSPLAQATMQSSLRDRIRALTLRMVRENAGYPPILEGVGSVLACTPDWSPAEAEESLTILLNKPTDEAARLLSHLLILYGVYRERKSARLGAFDGTRLNKLLRQQLVEGTPAIRSSILWRMSQILDKQPDEAKTLLPHVAAFTSGAYDRNAFFHFYKIAAEQTRHHPEVLGPALKNAVRREREHLAANDEQRIWSFDLQPWTALKNLLDSGRVDEFLDCVETIVDYRNRIYNFPEEDIRASLRQIPSDKAQEILNRLKFNQ